MRGEPEGSRAYWHSSGTDLLDARIAICKKRAVEQWQINDCIPHLSVDVQIPRHSSYPLRHIRPRIYIRW